MNVNFGMIHDYYMKLNLSMHATEVANIAEVLSFKKGEEISFAQDYIYFIKKGALSFSFRNDKRIIGNIVEYLPLGLVERFCPILQFRYLCASDITIQKISCQQFDKIFFETSPEQMKELTTILVYMLVFMFDVHVERRSESGFHIIKSMLSRYLYRREVNAEEKEGIASFIISRTNLSRSYVFRVLSDLKKGGYITIQKGKLVSIDKSIPDNY